MSGTHEFINLKCKDFHFAGGKGEAQRLGSSGQKVRTL